MPQIENIKLSGRQRELWVGCWDHVTRSPCMTGLPDSRQKRTTTSWFGIFSKWLLFAAPPRVGLWDQFHLSPHFSDCLMLWREELLRWPHYSLLDVSEGVVPCGCLM